METTTLDVIKSLATQELTLSSLYEAYSKLFPEYKDFWSGLVREEQVHAQWIQALFDDVEKGVINCKSDRFNPGAIDALTKYIEKHLQNVKNLEHITMLKAIAIALDIENSFIENSFFEVFEGDHPDLKRTLDNLKKASLKHRERVDQMRQDLISEQNPL